MRNIKTNRICNAATPIYYFDTDSTIERVIRDPLSVLLGRCKLSLQRDVVATDPYNRVGRFAQSARR